MLCSAATMHRAALLHGASFSSSLSLECHRFSATCHFLCWGSLVVFQVADVSEAVRQRADALMLSGESAMGQYPDKALSVLHTVSTRIESWARQHRPQDHTRSAPPPQLSFALSERISEQICAAAAHMGGFNGAAVCMATHNGATHHFLVFGWWTLLTRFLFVP